MKSIDVLRTALEALDEELKRTPLEPDSIKALTWAIEVLKETNA